MIHFRLINDAARTKIKEALAEIQQANPDAALFHGLLFVFGIDDKGQAIPGKEEIMNSFGPDIEGMQHCIDLMQEILNGYREAAQEPSHAPNQTH